MAVTKNTLALVSISILIVVVLIAIVLWNISRTQNEEKPSRVSFGTTKHPQLASVPINVPTRGLQSPWYEVGYVSYFGKKGKGHGTAPPADGYLSTQRFPLQRSDYDLARSQYLYRVYDKRQDIIIPVDTHNFHELDDGELISIRGLPGLYQVNIVQQGSVFGFLPSWF